MSIRCAVCGAELGEPIYRSEGGESLTSLCTVLPQDTEVRLCLRCGHLQTPPIGDLAAYYATAYRILLASEEEDQLYDVVDGRAVYRAEHQASTFLDRVELPDRARLLDYGAAKGATVRRIGDARPDVVPHFFDVSDMYVDYWRRIVDDSSFATFELPAAWDVSFDVVCSFFMLEHVERPTEVVATMRHLLRPGGTVYAVVPDPAVNVGDFIVVDHVNHFSAASLERLLLGQGFESVVVDGGAHRGAWVVTAKRPGDGPGVGEREPAVDVAPAITRARQLAEFWSGARQLVGQAEQALGDGPVAIYGAGFYGSFVRANLAAPERVVAYVDQNHHLQGTEHDGLPVVAPADLPAEVRDVFVGLNPVHARGIIADVVSWRQRPLTFHFLGDRVP